MTLALENNTIPPNIHFNTPNPKSKPLNHVMDFVFAHTKTKY